MPKHTQKRPERIVPSPGIRTLQMRQKYAKQMGKAGRAAFIIELCSIKAWSSLGRSFVLPSKLGFLLCKLVRRLSSSFWRRQQKQQQTLRNIRWQKLGGGSDLWLELLVCRSSDQAIDALLFLRHGMQKQHLVVSISPSIISEERRLLILCLLRQQNILPQNVRQHPGAGSGAAMCICVIVWTWKN